MRLCWCTSELMQKFMFFLVRSLSTKKTKVTYLLDTSIYISIINMTGTATCCLKRTQRTRRTASWRTRWPRLWSSLRTSRTKTYFRSSTASGWRAGSYSRHRRVTMPSRRWSRSWRARAASSIRVNCRGCSWTWAWARIWTKRSRSIWNRRIKPWTVWKFIIFGRVVNKLWVRLFSLFSSLNQFLCMWQLTS